MPSPSTRAPTCCTSSTPAATPSAPSTAPPAPPPGSGRPPTSTFSGCSATPRSGAGSGRRRSLSRDAGGRIAVPPLVRYVDHARVADAYLLAHLVGVHV